MMYRGIFVLVVALLVSGCRFFDTQTGPSANPTPETPVAVTLSGVVRATNASGAPVKGATVQILDGVNKGFTTVTDSKGIYKFEKLSAGNANVLAARDGFPDKVAGIYIDKGATLDFETIAPPWSARGTGSDVFEIPTWVSRVRIDGVFNGGTGPCESLSIRLENRSIATLTLGGSRCPGGVQRYQGVHLMAGGGMVEIFSMSSNISWNLEWIPN